MRWLLAKDRVAVPWKNGGGVTHEVDRHPLPGSLEDFDWRVSVARVASAGPFSRFEGVDRIMAVLEGELRLAIDGRPELRLIESSPPVEFPGEAAVSGAPISGVLDLNLMLRRGRCVGGIRRVDTAGVRLDSFRADATIIAYCAREPMVLERGEARHAFGCEGACRFQVSEMAGWRAAVGAGGSGYLVWIASARES